jgi:hypothetical protein
MINPLSIATDGYLPRKVLAIAAAGYLGLAPVPTETPALNPGWWGPVSIAIEEPSRVVADGGGVSGPAGGLGVASFQPVAVASGAGASGRVFGGTGTAEMNDPNAELLEDLREVLDVLMVLDATDHDA